MPDPQLIQVKKYPNRRLYDSTRSRHLTHEELYDLVVSGHTVRVTDSKTGADITNLVLAQALIERSPEKFAAFPPEVFHLLVRASEQMLHGMTANWFAQLMKGVAPFMSATPGATGAAAAPRGFAWPSPPGFAWPSAPAPTSASAPKTDPVADLQARMEAIMQELAKLRASHGS
ncbi:MAG: polyhydroxyalkanoate synthesis regulator DNA-binding domain-containing protein [Phycisphaerales bacterium]